MDKKVKTLSIAASTALATSLAMSAPVNAAENPFATNDLGSGYQLAFAEGKCGGNDKAKEGNCGEDKMGKGKEGTCGESKDKDKKKDQEGKCGEGKCGGSN